MITIQQMKKQNKTNGSENTYRTTKPINNPNGNIDE
jgi:hypothetical protein